MAVDLRLRNFSPATQRNYLLYARRFAAFFMRSPEELGEAEVRQFLGQRRSKGLAPYTDVNSRFGRKDFVGLVAGNLGQGA
jgi:hypothetical protein